ncbi:VWFA and cache domain-containing protein 1, partial [Biomphalaria glabrata]
MATKPCSFDRSSTQFLFNFSVYKYCVLILGVLLISYNCEVLSDNQWLDLPNHRAGRINIRNVDLDPSKRKINDVLTPDSKVTEYLTDTRQETANPSDIGGIIIQQASKDLSTRLRWLTNYEIGITDMQ